MSTAFVHLSRQHLNRLLAPSERRTTTHLRELRLEPSDNPVRTPVGGVPQHQQAAVVGGDAVEGAEQIGALQNGVVDGWGWHYVRGHPDEQPLSHRPAQVQLLASMQVA